MMDKQKWLDISEAIDALRMLPRAFMVVYILSALYVGDWYMGLDDPSTQQTTFVSILAGTLGAVTTWYYKTGRDWQRSE